jgi:hypothetical protein
MAVEVGRTGERWPANQRRNKCAEAARLSALELMVIRQQKTPWKVEYFTQSGVDSCPQHTEVNIVLPAYSSTYTNTMGAILQLVSYVLFLISLPLISALKFDIQAHHGHESAKYERCIRNFVAKDQLVVVTANVDGNRGDGQQLNLHVRMQRNGILESHAKSRTDQGRSRKRVRATKGCRWQ